MEKSEIGRTSAGRPAPVPLPALPQASAVADRTRVATVGETSCGQTAPVTLAPVWARTMPFMRYRSAANGEPEAAVAVVPSMLIIVFTSRHLLFISGRSSSDLPRCVGCHSRDNVLRLDAPTVEGQRI